MADIELRPESPIPPFSVVKNKVLSYIDNPHVRQETYRAVQRYFHAKCDLHIWDETTTNEAEELLYAMRSKIDLPQENIGYSHREAYGNAKIEMPHFYDVNQNTLSWFIYGSLRESANLTPQKKRELAGTLLYKSLLYDPLGYDLSTNKHTIEEELLTQGKTRREKLFQLPNLSLFRKKR